MKVLFATDGSVSALEAERLITKIADRDQVIITVLSVTPAGIPHLQDVPLMLDPLPARRKDASAIVDAGVERFLAAGFKADGRVLEGAPGKQIVDLVEEDWHELTVLGAGSKSWMGHLLLGSVSSYVLHSAPNSVLIVHETIAATETARVLFGTDGSRGSTVALSDYMDFADPTRCDTTAMAVGQLPLEDFIPTVPIPPTIDPEVAEKLKQASEDRSARLAESAVTRLRDEHFTATGRSLLGHPTSVLLEEADKGRYDMVVVGSRGLGPVRRALLGSVSDKLARHTRAALIGRHIKV